ncbi:MAG: nucleoside recognition domain-containing protein [Desulfococcaceae bacterium]
MAFQATAKKWTEIRPAVARGLRKGISGFWWVLKILVPISFFTLLLDFSGLLGRMDGLLTPVMGLLSLPPAAALPLIVGLLTGIYGAVAAMAVLPLTPDQMTLIAIFLLISHGLPVETMVQAKSGIRPFKAAAFRLSASVLTVLAAARFLNPATTVSGDAAATAATQTAFWPTLADWALSTGALALQILAIVTAIMVTLELLKVFQLLPALLRVLTPVLRLMGLDRRVGMLWLTAGLFGIAYGGAVIVEEARESGLDEQSLTRLHLSIGINHAMIEDPALFLPLGIGAFWLWVPRLIAAIVAVRLLDLWNWAARRRAERRSGRWLRTGKGEISSEKVAGKT